MIKIQSFGGYNLNGLKLLGKGTQGRVYDAGNGRCIKIFRRKRAYREELFALKLAQGDPHFPKLYSWGEKYIIRERIDGMELDEYLASHGLSPKLTEEILELFDAMCRIGYRRLDSALFHLFVTSGGRVRLIDSARAMRRSEAYPVRLLGGLERLGFKEMFLKQVNDTKPELYQKWSKTSKNDR